MTDQTFQSYLHLVKRAAIHSQQFRHTDYSSRNIPNAVIEDIGLQLVTLYEDLYETHSCGGTPPRRRTSEKSDGTDDGQVYTRPRPYR